MRLPEQRPRTHTLTIEVPVNLADSDVPQADLQEAMSDVLRCVMPIVKLGTLGLLCDDVQVTFSEADPGVTGEDAV